MLAGMRTNCKLYGTARWQTERLRFLRQHPLCKFHQEYKGELVAAALVDHIVPHKCDPKLFWDRSNWQALCTGCHDSVKRKLEMTGKLRGCDPTGRPIDPNHPWNRGAAEQVGGVIGSAPDDPA